MIHGRIGDHIQRLCDDRKLEGPAFPAAINRWVSLYNANCARSHLTLEFVASPDCSRIAVSASGAHRSRGSTWGMFCVIFVATWDNDTDVGCNQGNILIDEEEVVRLTDFGMSVTSDGTPYQYGSIHGGGAIRWTAPELIDAEEFRLTSRRPTFQSDVYSFGCVGYEVRRFFCRVLVTSFPEVPAQIYALQPPFAHLTQDYRVMRAIMARQRPDRPTLPDGGALSDDVWTMVSLSWAHEPSERPTVLSLLHNLEHIL